MAIKKICINKAFLFLISITIIVPLHAMEIEEEVPQQQTTAKVPTFSELKKQIIARSKYAKETVGYDLGMAVCANGYAGINDDSPIHHAAIYCYGAGQRKSEYASQLMELYMPVILFKFPDDAGKGMMSRLQALREMNLGQYADVKTMLYVLNACADAGIEHLHLIGYSRGGAALVNAIGVLNSFDESYNEWFQKVHINFGTSKELLARISSVILHCPLVNTKFAIKQTTQAFKGCVKSSITPQFVKRNEGVLSFYWRHTWPFSLWQSKEDPACGDTIEKTVLPAVSNYNPEEKQPIESIQLWPHSSFYVWLVLQKNDTITPITSSRLLAEEIRKTNQKGFYYCEGDSTLGHFDYWKEEKNGGLDAFFAMQNAPHDKQKLEVGQTLLAQMEQEKVELSYEDEEEVVKEED